ncbi:MAG: tryptophan synthase subunit alpha [Candidatus Wenzhouxiangella sp. M2_3B_020]
MNNRIDRRFAALSDAGRKGLIPYVTAGHPHPDATVDILHALVEHGADLVELGVPFSDVMADGPVIQNACQTALEHGTALDDVFGMVRRFRERDTETPLILMGYMNPVERRGLERFAEEAGGAGVDGLLIVDCPVDEAAETTAAFAEHGMHQIFLVSPTTTEPRIARLAPAGGGFIYYVSLKGVTGSAALDASSLEPALKKIRDASDLPVAIGFGISTAEQAREVSAVADAVVIGSALVSKLDETRSSDEAVGVVADYLGGIRSALDDAAVGAAAS